MRNKNKKPFPILFNHAAGLLFLALEGPGPVPELPIPEPFAGYRVESITPVSISEMPGVQELRVAKVRFW